MHVLVLNTGSSSIKFAVVETDAGEEPVVGLAERLGSPEARLVVQRPDAAPTPLPGADHAAALAALVARLDALGWSDRVAAVGHRVVHGAERFTGAVVVDDDVVAAIEASSHFAPLHNPANLLGLRAARAHFPALPQVAVFDTAFHQTLPREAFLYALPRDLYVLHGVRRYGFHGTSHRFVAAAAARRLGRPAEDLHLVTAHLGNGCSATAVCAGRSVDTSMGLTPLEGLVMGTRSGDVDPGALEHVAARTGNDLDGVLRLLNRESGLLGLSGGLSNDMRTLLEARADGHAGARDAIAVFCHRLARYVGALATSLPRLDALVFTGGIGEHAAPVRAETLARLGVLGLRLDPAANDAHGRDTNGRITVEGASPMALVVPTNEELAIARETAALVGPPA